MLMSWRWMVWLAGVGGLLGFVLAFGVTLGVQLAHELLILIWRAF